MEGNLNVLKLSFPTVFSDLNTKLGKDSTFITTDLKLNTIKYKHLKQLINIKPQEHIEYLMRWITDLTETDLQEVSADDIAELIKFIHNSMKKYQELAHAALGNFNNQQHILSGIES